MKINRLENNINFNAGYSSKIALMEKRIKPSDTEIFFRNSDIKDFGTFYHTDLKNNKTLALGNRLCANIFTKFRKFYDFRQGKSAQTLIFPQDIYVFNANESKFYDDSDFFVNIASIRPNKDLPTFYPGTIFMNNELKSLEYLDSQIEKSHNKNILSSNHFLHSFIHEWLHAQFTNILKARANFGSYCYDKTVQTYEKQTLNDKEKEMVGNIIGTYAFSKNYGHYTELFAESWTKFISEALSEDCKSFAKNPVDILKSMPKEFQNLLEKVSQVKMYHLFDNE